MDIISYSVSFCEGDFSIWIKGANTPSLGESSSVVQFNPRINKWNWLLLSCSLRGAVTRITTRLALIDFHHVQMRDPYDSDSAHSFPPNISFLGERADMWSLDLGHDIKMSQTSLDFTLYTFLKLRIEKKPTLPSFQYSPPPHPAPLGNIKMPRSSSSCH